MGSRGHTMSLQLLTHCVQQAPEAVTHVPTATAGVCVWGVAPQGAGITWSGKRMMMMMLRGQGLESLCFTKHMAAVGGLW